MAPEETACNLIKLSPEMSLSGPVALWVKSSTLVQHLNSCLSCLSTAETAHSYLSSSELILVTATKTAVSIAQPFYSFPHKSMVY